MAVAIAITLLVSLTLTPVLMAIVGPRIGTARPTSRRNTWERTGQLVAGRPGRVLAAGMLILVALALALPGIRLSFDERAAQPSTTPSNRGYQALNAHFPKNATLPDYLLITSPHDLRNPADLAALNTLSAAIAKVPGVAAVYSITQPSGTPITQARISQQLSSLAANLKKASSGLTSNQPQLTKLSNGTSKIANGTSQAADGSQQLSAAIPNFVTALTKLSDGLSTAAGKSGTAVDGSQQLHDAAQQLADGLQHAHDQAATGVSAISQIINALDKDVLCNIDPICNKARAGLHQLYTAQQQLLLPGLQTAADGARQIANGNQQLATGLATLHDGLSQASSGATQLQGGATQLQTNVSQLATGLHQLADATSRLPAGISKLVQQTSSLSTGLSKADNYLSTVSHAATSSDAAGFYLPASALNSSQFAAARTAYLSADGKTARIQIIGTTDPQTIRHTVLASATISATGAAGLGSDLRHYLALDGRFVVIAVLLCVFILLVITLRSLIAPLYLIASVIVSCAAALGLTTLVWQHLLGHAIEFNVPIIAFVLLVAVGADYNILLMSRMREHGHNLTKEVVAASVTATGPVITAAGVIFASTFLALIFVPISGIAQTGFAVASGLILDTIVVRSLVVPACAALLGSRSWWPHRPAHTRPDTQRLTSSS
jgi:RND superfamily putative drug exporter